MLKLRQHQGATTRPACTQDPPAREQRGSPPKPSRTQHAPNIDPTHPMCCIQRGITCTRSARQSLNPSRSSSASSSRPMKTMRLVRGSPSRHARAGDPSNRLCTPCRGFPQELMAAPNIWPGYCQCMSPDTWLLSLESLPSSGTVPCCAAGWGCTALCRGRGVWLAAVLQTAQSVSRPREGAPGRRRCRRSRRWRGRPSCGTGPPHAPGSGCPASGSPAHGPHSTDRRPVLGAGVPATPA